MRVLFVIHYPVFGGPHNQALNLAAKLEEFGIHLVALLPEPRGEEQGNAVERLRDAGVDVATVPLDRVRASRDPRCQLEFVAHAPRDVRGIRRVIREQKIDLVQIGGLVNPHGAIAARLERVPVIWQLLDTRSPMVVRRAIMPIVLKLSDVVMATGWKVAEAHPGADSLGDRLRIFYPPVDPGRFDATFFDRADARVEWGFAPEDRVIGAVGNLNPQKGHEFLLRAAAIVRRVLDDVKVLIVGASHDTHRAYERMLHDLTRDLGMSIGGDVVFAGGLSDVRPALAAVDVFVLSSVPLSEGAPTVIEEAMMMNLPVVATDVGSVSELVEHGETGFVVRPEDPEAIADAVVRMFSSPTTLGEFSARAHMVAEGKFSTSECARVHVAAYEYVLHRRSRSARSWT